MKRALALFLALVMALALVGCSGKSSNVSLDDYEKSFLQALDEEWTFSTEESNGGYAFSFTGEVYGIYPLTVEGSADKNQMVEQAIITFERVPEDYFQKTTALSIVQDLADYMNVPMTRLATDTVLITAFTPMLGDATVQDGVELILAALDSSQTQDGWTYTLVLEGKTLTMTAEYTG